MRRIGLRIALVAVAIALVGLGALVDPRPAWACSCAPTSTARALTRADAVFRGTVLATRDVGRGRDARTDIRFSVDRVYKGYVYAEQVVASAPDSAACGLVPDPGSTWVIFATESVAGSGKRTVQRLLTTQCSGNLPGAAAPTVLGPGRGPRSGASDTEERALGADANVTRVLGIAGLGVAALVVLAVVGTGLLWRSRSS